MLAGVTCLALLNAWHSERKPARAQDAQPPKVGKADEPAGKLLKYLGAGTCIRCHTEGPAGRDDDKFVLLTEYATWRTQDKHAFAYLALAGEMIRRDELPGAPVPPDAPV